MSPNIIMNKQKNRYWHILFQQISHNFPHNFPQGRREFYSPASPSSALKQRLFKDKSIVVAARTGKGRVDFLRHKKVAVVDVPFPIAVAVGPQVQVFVALGR